MIKTIAILPGDGIGPEITDGAVKVLDKVASKFNHKFLYDMIDVGGCSIDKYGVPITAGNMQRCKEAASVLLGAVGGPKWDKADPLLRPEKALLAIRKELGLFANLRPIRLFDQLSGASPLKEEIASAGIDLVIVRELTGGIYFGEHRTYEIEKKQKTGDTEPKSEGGTNSGAETEQAATDIMTYAEYEIERIGRVAFETAMKRRKKLTSVDKANVLDTSKLWRATMHRLAESYPEVEYNDLYVDNAAMQLIRDPGQFDVIVTENMFGDILSDEASVLTGSIGLMPSASLSQQDCGMYEPIHGSAPDIAGTDVANPLGTILSAAMLLRYSFGLEEEAQAIETAVNRVLNDGFRTADICRDGDIKTGCREMSSRVADAL